MTKVPGVFAGGDAEHGPRTAVEAVRSGKIAAVSIDAWLRAGQPWMPLLASRCVATKCFPWTLFRAIALTCAVP